MQKRTKFSLNFETIWFEISTKQLTEYTRFFAASSSISRTSIWRRCGSVRCQAAAPPSHQREAGTATAPTPICTGEEEYSRRKCLLLNLRDFLWSTCESLWSMREPLSSSNKTLEMFRYAWTSTRNVTLNKPQWSLLRQNSASLKLIKNNGANGISQIIVLAPRQFLNIHKIERCKCKGLNQLDEENNCFFLKRILKRHSELHKIRFPGEYITLKI